MNEKYVKNKLYPLPVLYTKRLTMRPICRKDCSDMYEYCSIPEVSKYVTWDRHESLRVTKRHIKNIKRAYKKRTFHDWALVTHEGKMIGTCGFTSFLFKDGACEIGYVINPAYQNRSFATESAKRLIRFAFEELGAERVFARYMEGNAASRRVMEKCGMSETAINLPDAVKNGETFTIYGMAITADEYRALNN